MNASLTFTILALFIELVYPFTFRSSSSSTSENVNTISRIVNRKPQQQIVFPTLGTTSTTTTTLKPLMTATLSTLPRLEVTTVPSINLSLSLINSTVQGNSFSPFVNFTDILLPNKTIESDKNDSASVVVESATTPEPCVSRIGQGATTKKTNYYYLSDADIRSKLCSNINSTFSKEQYRFDLDAKVCSQIRKQSHCGKNMIFTSYAGNIIYGHCDCDYSSQIPLIYHPQTNRCYFMYQQGYCGDDEWVEMTIGNGTASCRKNKCYNSGRTQFGSPPLAARDQAPEYVPLRGNVPCVKLNQPSKQYCKQPEHIVAFRWPREFYPNCGPPVKNPSLSERFLGDVASHQCNPGSYSNVMGTCEPSWEFE